MNKIKTTIELIRVKQWIKNFLIFIPALCAQKINFDNLWIFVVGFFAFSLLTSFIYIINDIKDIEKDKKHPRKKNRPLPSGRISKNGALILAAIMLVLSCILNYAASGFSLISYSWIFLGLYLVLNLGYSFGLKNVAVLDVAILSAGFIIRIYYGGEIAGVPVSSWLFLTVLSASMFLALGKRKKELSIGSDIRKVLQKYTENYLNKFEYVFLALTFIFYSLWSMEQDNIYLIFTVPLVILIFMKYCLILEKSDEGDPTTLIYKNKLLLGACIIYGLIMLVILCL